MVKKKGKAKKGGKAEDKELRELLGKLPEKPVEAAPGHFKICERMSPRVAYSAAVLPKDEICFFGGEFYNGKTTVQYNDTYKYNPVKNSWKVLESSHAPHRRCAHQTVFAKNNVYLFGGEIVKDERCAHFKDLWSLDLKENKWEELKPIGVCPGARSGHRMVAFRGSLLLFGGFYDTGKTVRYFDDLWIYKVAENNWTKIAPLNSIAPTPRSAVNFLTSSNDEELIIFGGFSKIKDTNRVVVGKTHNDLWRLSTTNIFDSIPKVEYSERLPKGIPQRRAGISLCFVKKQLLAFGGVYDEAVVEEEATAAHSPQGKKKKAEPKEEPKEEGEDATIKSHYYNDLYSILPGQKFWTKIEVEGGKPFPRSSATVVPWKRGFLLFGGSSEDGKKALSLDDIWQLDQNTDGKWIWHCVQEGTYETQEWEGSDSEESLEDENEEGGSSDGESSDEENEEENDEENEEENDEESSSDVSMQ